MSLRRRGLKVCAFVGDELTWAASWLRDFGFASPSRGSTDRLCEPPSFPVRGPAGLVTKSRTRDLDSEDLPEHERPPGLESTLEAKAGGWRPSGHCASLRPIAPNSAFENRCRLRSDEDEASSVPTLSHRFTDIMISENRNDIIITQPR